MIDYLQALKIVVQSSQSLQIQYWMIQDLSIGLVLVVINITIMEMGGLLKHTYEVYQYCVLVAMQHNGNCKGVENRINPNELFISAIWHDYGKIWDYQMDENGVWGKHNNHARQIHHISRSSLEWNKHVEKLKSSILYDGDINTDNLTHNILSHHGCREWGSPVAPATREAWILHLADNLSARLDDCDKHDILKH